METYQIGTKELLEQLQTNLKTGMTAEMAAKRQAEEGKNELAEKKKKTLLQMFFDQFKDFLVIILLAAAGISIVTAIFQDGEGLLDGLIILAIVLLNAVLGVTQEQKATNALAALKKMSSPHAKVLRDGKTVEIASPELVRGDIVFLETGDFVPADLRLLESTNLQTDESALTGESAPVEKHAKVVYKDSKPLAERQNMSYMSTLVTYGKGIGVVADIGMKTEIGKIATLLDTVEEGKTPLQKTIDEFAKILGIICILVSVLVFVLGLLQGNDVFEIFLTAIALAVAAIPEGLTAVITVVLAMGMQRMVKRHAIIKNLSTVETLGQATVICSDKTGTLTQNKMTVQKVFDLDREYQVTGTGYALDGAILFENQPVSPTANLDTILKICVLCNDAKLEGSDRVIGDPTEGALLVLAAKGGFDAEKTKEKYEQLNEYSFDSDRKMMTSVNVVEGTNFVFTKGACDQLIKKCQFIRVGGQTRPITVDDKEMILHQNEQYSKQAFRVLGYAYQTTDEPMAKNLEQNLIFVGLTAMIDPPRPEAAEAIKQCHQAGIRVMMITGDHLTTAKAIATELGILKPGHLALSGEDTEKMTDEEYESAILQCDVFARSTPKDKIRIVDILQKHGEIVSMTGDGVNDSPALKQADIGVAMGITGTEVSKEASNMILTDDNFASIVSAVEEGRVIYSNIRKFTIYLVSCNIGEILIILLSMIFAPVFIGLGGLNPGDSIVPLLAIHLLWINLMTDSFPAFALGMEAQEKGIMEQKPRGSQEKLLNKRTLVKIFIQGAGLALAALTSFTLGLILDGSSLAQARTMVFITVVFGELIRTYSARSETKFLFQMKPFSNKSINVAVLFSLGLVLLLVYLPFLAGVFGLEALTVAELGIAAGLGLVPFLFAEATKLHRPHHQK